MISIIAFLFVILKNEQVYAKVHRQREIVEVIAAAEFIILALLNRNTVFIMLPVMLVIYGCVWLMDRK